MALRLSTGLRNSLLNGGAGEGFRGALNTGFLYIYSGSQPASADSAASGTLLAVIYSNYPTNTVGLSFDAAADGEVDKAAAQTWSGAAIATGTAGWFRFQALSTDETGTRAAAAAASTSSKRFDGSIATSGGDINISSTSITSGAVQTVSSLTVTMPES